MQTLFSRKYAYQKGKYAECLAALFLMFKGYRWVVWRQKIPYEVDLIMRKGNYLVVVEVKYRANITDGLYAINPEKIRKLCLIANNLPKYYRRKNRVEYDIRIDVVIVGNYKIIHLQNAVMA